MATLCEGVVNELELPAPAVSVAGGALSPALKDPSQFRGFSGAAAAPSTVLLAHNGLHIEIHFDRTHPIGKTDKAGISDVVLERRRRS